MTYITQPTSGNIKLTDELALIRKETFPCIIVGYKVNWQKKYVDFINILTLAIKKNTHSEIQIVTLVGFSSKKFSKQINIYEYLSAITIRVFGLNIAAFFSYNLSDWRPRVRLNTEIEQLFIFNQNRIKEKHDFQNFRKYHEFSPFDLILIFIYHL